MADGRQHTVRDEFGLALGNTNVVVVDEHWQAHVLPLLTVTGLSYLRKENGSTAS